MPGMKKKKYKPFNSAIPHIRCGVCKELAHALHSQVEALPPADKPAGQISSRGKAPKGKVNEADVEEVITNVCDPKHQSGRWTTSIDIMDGAALVQPHSLFDCIAGALSFHR